MKKIIGLVICLMMVGAIAYAADGDLIVNGKIGVGTSTPQTKLDVNGSIRTAAGQNFKIRYGSGSVTFTASHAAHSEKTYGVVSFGYTFTSAPIVIITGTVTGNPTALVPNASSKTTTGFTLDLFNSYSLALASGTVYTFNWVAIGE